MKLRRLLTLTSLLLPSTSPFLVVAAAAATNTTTPIPSGLNLTAVAASNGSSILECWKFPHIVASAQPGTSGALNLFLGDIANASYTIIPSRFNGGLHNAPAVQFVSFLSGLAHITLPNSTDEVWVQGGKYGLIVAADTPAVSRYGHLSDYPGDADTVSLQIPVQGGVLPNYTVLHQGPCGWADMTGI